MPYQPRPTFQPATPIGAAASNFLSALYSGPTATERAQAEKAQMDMEQMRQQQMAAQNISDLMVKMMRQEGAQLAPDASVDERVQYLMPELLGSMARAGKFTEAGPFTRTVTANAPGLKDTGMIDRAMLGAGQSYGSTIQGTREGNQLRRDMVAMRPSSAKQPIVGADGRPTTPAIEAKKKQQMLGRKTFDTIVDQMASVYEDMNKKGYLVSPEQSALGNMVNNFMNTEAPENAVLPRGQTFGSMGGTDRQKYLDQIGAKLALAKTALRNATGISAKEVDSIFEAKQFAKALTSPTQNIDAIRSTLKDLKGLYGEAAALSPAGALAEGETDIPSQMPVETPASANPNMDAILAEYARRGRKPRGQ